MEKLLNILYDVIDEEKTNKGWVRERQHCPEKES
jgi:hypothetical protein